MTAWISGQEDIDTALKNIDESWPARSDELPTTGGPGAARGPPARASVPVSAALRTERGAHPCWPRH